MALARQLCLASHQTSSHNPTMLHDGNLRNDTWPPRELPLSSSMLPRHRNSALKYQTSHISGLAFISENLTEGNRKHPGPNTKILVPQNIFKIRKIALRKPQFRYRQDAPRLCPLDVLACLVKNCLLSGLRLGADCVWPKKSLPP